MMTINISLPEKLKNQTQALVKQGYYASFSDAVRDSLRRLITGDKYRAWIEEAKEDERTGKTKILKSAKGIDEYVGSL